MCNNHKHPKEILKELKLEAQSCRRVDMEPVTSMEVEDRLKD